MFPKPSYKKQRIKVQKITMQLQKECYITRRPDGLHKHHIFYGPCRKWSELYGLYIWLRPEWHTGDNGIHFDKQFDLRLKREAQARFEEEYSRDLFMQLFGRNYID